MDSHGHILGFLDQSNLGLTVQIQFEALVFDYNLVCMLVKI
jgi:hypothetical protein